MSVIFVVRFGEYNVHVLVNSLIFYYPKAALFQHVAAMTSAACPCHVTVMADSVSVNQASPA